MFWNIVMYLGVGLFSSHVLSIWWVILFWQLMSFSSGKLSLNYSVTIFFPCYFRCSLFLSGPLDWFSNSLSLFYTSVSFCSTFWEIPSTLFFNPSMKVFVYHALNFWKLWFVIAPCSCLVDSRSSTGDIHNMNISHEATSCLLLFL